MRYGLLSMLLPALLAASDGSAAVQRPAADRLYPVVEVTLPVLKSDRELVIVAVKRRRQAEVVVLDPAGTQHRAASPGAGMSWSSGDAAEVIGIRSPRRGPWVVRYHTGEIAHVKHARNLELKASALRAEAPERALIRISASVDERGRPVDLPELLGSTRFEAVIAAGGREAARLQLVDDGTQGDVLRGDGRYTAEFVPVEAANYQVTVRAVAGGIARERVLHVTSGTAAAPSGNAAPAPVSVPAATVEAGAPALAPVSVSTATAEAGVPVPEQAPAGEGAAEDAAMDWSAVWERFRLTNYAVLAVLLLAAGAGRVAQRHRERSL